MMSEWRACGRDWTGGGVGACLPRRRSSFSVARSAFTVACLWVGSERGLVWVSQFGRGARCV